MQDDLDQMLQGQDPAPASPAQNEDQGTDPTQSTQTVEQQDPGEVEFNSLSGSTQDRIRRLSRDKKDLADRIEALERMSVSSTQVPPAPGSAFKTPDERQAIELLASKGITTDDKMQKALDEKINALRWEQEQGRLGQKYSGSNGEPQYVREEVEDFIQSHPEYRGYAAEDVFRFKMFPQEFASLEAQKLQSKTGKTQTLKPTGKQTSQDQGLTPEFIAERTDSSKYSDAAEWQMEHRVEIDKVLSRMVQE